MELITPYITGIVILLIGGIVTAFLLGYRAIQNKISTLIDRNTTGKNRELLHQLASEAHALFENTLLGEKGQEKLQQAEAYVSRMLGKLGISFSSTEIRAAIEKAVLQYNLTAKPPDSIPQDSFLQNLKERYDDKGN